MEKSENKQNYFKGKYLKFYIIYTFLFAVLSFIIFGVFIKENKTFIWSSDGLNQHYISLVYYGEYLRKIIGNIFVRHEFTLPMWEMSMGYGSDILQTLHYYVLGDPLNLLAVFFSGEQVEYLYVALIIARIFLTGITFSVYALYRKKSRKGTLIGALIYCFSGFVLCAGVRHPFFVNPMIYLPIILIGIDEIFKKKKPYIFILSIAVSAVSNFYFFYMLCIFMFLYAIFRYWITEKRWNIKAILGWLIKFISFFLIGIMIAAPIFLPTILNMMSSQRLSLDNYIPLLYEKTYYLKAVLGFTGYVKVGGWNILAYTPTALLSVLVLFIKKKKNKELKIGFLLITAFLCIPYIGSVFNGFSYVTLRWVWGYSMIVAYIVASVVPYLGVLIKREKQLVCAGMLLWMVAIFVLHFVVETSLKRYRLMAVCMGILTLLLILSLLVLDKRKYLFQMGILLITIVALSINGVYCYSDVGYAYADEFISRDEGWGRITNTPSDAIQDENRQFFRYDQYGTNEMYNITLKSKKNSTQFYFSTANSDISAFIREMYLNTASDYQYVSLDGRSYLEALAAVKYFMVKDGGEGYLPYNYEDEKNGGITIGDISFSAYQNKNALPLGFTFSDYIKRQEYENMNVLQKQEALLQGVVLEESDYQESNVKFLNRELSYNMVLGEGIEQKDENTFCVSQKNAEVTLDFQGEKGSETYIILKNLHYEGKDEVIGIQVKGEYNTKSIRYRSEKFRGYCGIHDFLCNIGYSEEAQNRITLIFPSKGTYTIDEIEIACQPIYNIDRFIDELKEDVLENVVLKTNYVKGDISLNESKILFLSIPYSKGFKAYVDGQPHEIKKANTMYMALELEPGEHQIELKYTTPYLMIGVGLMFIGILCFVCLLCPWQRIMKGYGKQNK